MTYRHCHGRVQTESSDCTVRALSIAANIPYPEAHEALRKAGRVDNRAMSVTLWFPVFQSFGLCEDKDKLNSPYPPNNLIVVLPKHIYSIRDMKHSDFGTEQYLNARDCCTHLYKPKLVWKAWRIPV